MVIGDIEIIENNRYIPEAIRLIDNAQNEILLSTYKLQIIRTPRGRHLLALIYALIKAIQRGIPCKIMLHYNTNKKGAPSTNLPSMVTLSQRGADIRYLPTSRIIHTKMLVVDSKKMITGSHNWSLASLTRNYEVSLLVSDSLAVLQAKKSFMSVWSQGTPFK